MKQLPFSKSAIAFSLSLILLAMTTSSAQAQRGGLSGDWNITTEFGDSEFESILAFSRDRDGNQSGSWITFFGMIELKNIQFEDNDLSFEQTFSGRNGEQTSTFKGSIDGRNLSGALTSERGDSKVVGERAPRSSRAAGDWAMTIKAGEREYKGTLALKNGSSNSWTGMWKSDRGEGKITDITYRRGELSFKRMIETQDSEWETTYKGTIRGNQLTGTFSSDRGEAEGVGERINGAVIGTWLLDVESEQGPRQQRLRVHSDLSALFGSTEVEKVTLDGHQLKFKIVSHFGDREFESDFQGKLSDGALTGELATPQGNRKVTGKKIVRTSGRGR
jgi:hypothetical protein